MPRIRTIKPSFFQSDDVSALPLRARLTWIGLWTQCDDQGRAKDHARLIKAAIWPLDNVSLADIEEDLSTLAAHGRIVRYEADGQRYLEVVNWSEHQAINRPTPSKIPGPGRSHSLNGHGGLSEDSRREGKGREGKGRDARARIREPPASSTSESEPPRNCEKHTGLGRAAPRCGPCASARKAHEAWEADRRNRWDKAPKCPIHLGDNLAANCGPCRAEELSPP